MDLEFTDEQQELRRSVRSFLESECPPSFVREVMKHSERARDLWAAMVALDWPALTIAEENGGLGLGFVELAVTLEEAGARLAPGPYSAVTQFSAMVREVGTEAQQAQILKPIAAGQQIGTLAVTDHAAAWSLDSITTRAQPRQDGSDGWQLTGVKRAVMAAEMADEFAVIARTSGETGDSADSLGVFLVPRDHVEISPITSLDASRPLSTVSFQSVSIPNERRLGDGDDRRAVEGIRRALEEATVGMAVETVGTCQALFDLIVSYAKERHQFGVPIGSFQAVKHKLADMFVVIERARALAYFAVAAIAEDDAGRALAAAMAKGAADDCQRQVCQDSIQLFGGIGFTWEHDAHLFVKRAKTTGALFGTGSADRLAIARQLGLATSGTAPT